MADLQKEIKLDLSNIPHLSHKAVKDEVGNFLINQVLRDVERGFSPVEGEGQFKKLTKGYADKEKGGRRTANLELEGDLKEAIKFRRTKEGIVFGNLVASQKEKADGHNQHSQKAKNWAAKNNFPKRRYIPDSSEDFRDGIEQEIKDIVKSFEEIPFEEVSTGVTTTNDTETGNKVTTSIVDLFDDDFINAEIRRQLDEG